MPNIIHPLTGKQAPICTVLTDLAAQENCDGEPYDQMVEAVQYIKELEHELQKQKNLGHAAKHTLEAFASGAYNSILVREAKTFIREYK